MNKFKIVFFIFAFSLFCTAIFLLLSLMYKFYSVMPIPQCVLTISVTLNCLTPIFGIIAMLSYIIFKNKHANKERI